MVNFELQLMGIIESRKINHTAVPEEFMNVSTLPEDMLLHGSRPSQGSCRLKAIDLRNPVHELEPWSCAWRFS